MAPDVGGAIWDDGEEACREAKARKGKWPLDIVAMHEKFGIAGHVAKMPLEQQKKFLEFRIKFLSEEHDEMLTAPSADVFVDSLIDYCVVAIGTLDLFGVDAQTAWERVHAANMAKEVGVNPTRPNPFGFSDLIKPPGWTAPCHKDNAGLLEQLVPLPKPEVSAT